MIQLFLRLNINLIYEKVRKQFRLGASTELNHLAMIISIFIRYVDAFQRLKILLND